MERRIIEGIESCRPGSDDLLAPELADVAQCIEFDSQAGDAYQRAQKWDASVSRAMEQVEVPAGLSERILAALGQQAETADLNSGLQAILIEGDTLTGAADKRREGLVMGE